MDIMEIFSIYLNELKLEFKRESKLFIEIMDLDEKKHQFNFNQLNNIYGFNFTVDVHDVVKRVGIRTIKCPLSPKYKGNDDKIIYHIKLNILKIIQNIDNNINKHRDDDIYKSVIVSKIEYIPEFGNIIYNIDVVKATAKWEGEL